jgi:hypothetical protein
MGIIFVAKRSLVVNEEDAKEKIRPDFGQYLIIHIIPPPAKSSCRKFFVTILVKITFRELKKKKRVTGIY